MMFLPACPWGRMNHTATSLLTIRGFPIEIDQEFSEIYGFQHFQKGCLQTRFR
jgi:hypothetical protein